MATSPSPILVVVGATGVQGGSVVSHFLSLPDKPYRLRGITRNVDSDAAKSLAQKGVEMVTANLNDTDSLIKAFKGASALFFTTDAVGPNQDPKIAAEAEAAGKSLFVYTYEYERQHGINVFHAASQTNSLERVVFSGLANITKMSEGKYTKAYAFDAKAHAAEHAKEAYPELWKKTSILQVGFYLSNILKHPLFIPEQVRYSHEW
jgi:nucleoside-diphosphate-sugar epimerase